MQRGMDIAAKGEYLCLLVCSGAISMCDPFLIPFVERSVLLAKRMHGLRGRHLGFDRDEVCLEGRAEVIPTAKVGMLESKGGLLSISGPFTGRGAKFEMSQGTSDALAVSLEDVLVEEVICFERRPKRFGLAAGSIKGFGWRAHELWRGGGHCCQRTGHCRGTRSG